MSFQCLLSQGNDHRWTATFAPSLQLISMTMSRSFQFDKRENWAAKLKEVHSFAWKQWTENLSHKTGYQLSADKIQSAGVVSEELLDELAPEVANIAPKTQYQKR